MTPTGELTCERDGTPTRLTCVQCRTPICPQCFVRTPVGLKCASCGSEGPARGARRSALVWLVPAAIAGVLFATLVLPRLDSSPEGSTANPLEETVPTAIGVANPEMRVRYARVGQEARDGDLAFTVSAIDCGVAQVTGGPATRNAQGSFCFLHLNVKNFGRNPATFQGRMQMLLDDQSRRFGPDTGATQAHPENGGQDLVNVVVNPGNELKAVLVFDVPDDVEPVVAALRSSQRGRGTFVNLQPPS